MQFGAKPLFENVSVKFGDGNRYGLIGANGCGKSTFMKILAGVLEPTSGNVSLDSNERMAFLKQDQFAYEDQRVLDVVMMGHEEMWRTQQEKDAIYMNPEATEDDYMKAAELETQFAEYDGYTAEARARRRQRNPTRTSTTSAPTAHTAPRRDQKRDATGRTTSSAHLRTPTVGRPSPASGRWRGWFHLWWPWWPYCFCSGW